MSYSTMKFSVAKLSTLLVAFAFLGSLGACTSSKTNPILDDKGQILAGSVASLEKIKIGGVDQWVLIRGNKIDNPILLKLHGGPGQAEMATVHFNKLLEQDFIVVEWDQRGAGKSADAIDPESAMTVNQFVQDTHELTEYLLKRFHQKKLILVGSSWGSVIGLKAVKEYPDLYRAIVSTGQIANFTAGMQVGYRFLMDEAKRRNDQGAQDELAKIGPPPYFGAAASSKQEQYGKWLTKFGGLWHSSQEFDRVGWMLSSVEYAWPEKIRYTSAAQKSFNILMPQLAAINMNVDVSSVAVPVYFAEGRYDRMAPFEVSQQYFAALNAPKKEWIWFENSAHFPQWEESEKFHDLLTKKVVPETQTVELAECHEGR
jgi:pimeloyl-ACP methyl ester carboxylesterase